MFQILEPISYLLSFVGYYYYHTKFTIYLNTLLSPRYSRKKTLWISFIINYLSFIVFGLLQLHLIVNWTLFTFLLVVEIRFFYKPTWSSSLFYGLSCTLMGLSFNILLRSMMALLINVPPQAFDNNIFSEGNIKAYPVALGFFATGFFYKLVHTSDWEEKTLMLVKDKSSLFFMLRLMLVMYIYLALNLLLYYTPGNILILKLWSIKSAVSVIIGFCVAVLFTSRMRELNQYRYENLKVQNEIEAKAYEEKRLFIMAHTDPLTGLYTRGYAEQQLEHLLVSKESFSLCFVDLNGLKYVNDNLGHQNGDRYLTIAAKALSSICQRESDLLCRYGGDEFLLYLSECSRQNAEKLMLKAEEQLKSEGGFLAPYEPSFSYGMVEKGECGTVREMIAEADRRMYRNKMEFRGRKGS